MRKIFDGGNLKIGDVVYHEVFGYGDVIHIRSDLKIVKVCFYSGYKDIRADLGHLSVSDDFPERRDDIREEDIEWF